MRKVSGGDDKMRSRIVARAAAMSGNETHAMQWFEHAPIAAFGGRTAAQMVKTGHAEAVMSLLEGMDNGVYA